MRLNISSLEVTLYGISRYTLACSTGIWFCVTILIANNEHNVIEQLFGKRPLFFSILLFLLNAISFFWVRHIQLKYLKNTLTSQYMIAQQFNLYSAQVHSFRNHYSNLMYMHYFKSESVTRQYVENSGTYFSKSLSKKVYTSWTLTDELDLLGSFYKAQKIQYGEVKINRACIPSNTDEIKFIGDVLTVLLHNAMKHAFVGKINEPTFTIKIDVVEKKLAIEVSDNGIGKLNPEDYFPVDRESSGLSLVRRRLEIEFDIRRLKYSQDIFQISKCSPLHGTTIKFYYPYEIATRYHVNS